GDTIVLAPGNYTPTATLDFKSNVTLVGNDTSARGAVISGAEVDPSNPDVIDIHDGGAVTIKNLSIRLADRHGIAIDVAGTLNLESSEVSQNNALNAVVGEQGSTLVIRNSTISDNLGTGVAVLGTATIANSTITANTIAGVYVDPDGKTSLASTIVWGNGNKTKDSTDCTAKVDSSSSSLDGDGSCGANVHGDPRLGPLA